MWLRQHQLLFLQLLSSLIFNSHLYLSTNFLHLAVLAWAKVACLSANCNNLYQQIAIIYNLIKLYRVKFNESLGVTEPENVHTEDLERHILGIN